LAANLSAHSALACDGGKNRRTSELQLSTQLPSYQFQGTLYLFLT